MRNLPKSPVSQLPTAKKKTNSGGATVARHIGDGHWLLAKKLPSVSVHCLETHQYTQRPTLRDTIVHLNSRHVTQVTLHEKLLSVQVANLTAKATALSKTPSIIALIGCFAINEQTAAISAYRVFLGGCDGIVHETPMVHKLVEGHWNVPPAALSE